MCPNHFSYKAEARLVLVQAWQIVSMMFSSLPNRKKNKIGLNKGSHIIDNFLTFEMWDGIFCTFYADSFFKWKIMTSFLGKFDTQKIISHRCQLGDKVCRMKGSHQWVDYNIRVSRKHILCYFHQGCHIPILFLEGGGEFSPLCPWIPERRMRFCRKILDIIGIFRPSQANTFDFAQRSMAQ